MKISNGKSSFLFGLLVLPAVGMACDGKPEKIATATGLTANMAIHAAVVNALAPIKLEEKESLGVDNPEVWPAGKATAYCNGLVDLWVTKIQKKSQYTFSVNTEKNPEGGYVATVKYTP